MNQLEHEKCEFWTKMMNSLQELVVYPAPTHLKFASLANSKHILTGQKNSALTSLQCSRLATENQNLWKLAPTWLQSQFRNDYLFSKKSLFFAMQLLMWCSRLTSENQNWWKVEACNRGRNFDVDILTRMPMEKLSPPQLFSASIVAILLMLYVLCRF